MAYKLWPEQTQGYLGKAVRRADNEHGALVKLDVLTAAGSFDATPDTFGYARARMARLVGAAIRLGAIQGFLRTGLELFEVA